MNVTQFLDQLTSDPSYAGQMVARHTVPARRARYAEPAEPLPDLLRERLAAQGVERLYAHQAAALDAVRAGHDVVVVTGTASGKTLCYNLPVLEGILADRRARALYLFPLKALGRDQLAKLQAFGLWEQVRAAVYDGDTPADERRLIRDAAHLVLTNPDMLHLGLLPHHERWHAFFTHLRYVVIDEVHTYRGVFGSHVAHVLRRLRRICARHGAAPQFIGCSATIGNPRELFERLTGADDPAVIDRNGAPSGRRHLVVWNPPPLRETSGRRRSGNIEATFLLRELVQAGIRTLGFTLARAEAEIILRYLRAALDVVDPALTERVAVYRAGYLAEDRRRVEQGLAGGELTAVVSTVALEAGIDIGGLDATVLIGYPGTAAGFWQQIGRAGRGRRDSLALLVTRDSLVDQYFAVHPEALWSASSEAALIDPENLYIATGHLLCAAYEGPLRRDELARFGPDAEAVADFCAEQGWLERRGGEWLYTDPTYPAAKVSLRAASNLSYELVDPAGRILGSEDDVRLWDLCFPGAVVLHDGEQYLSRRIDQAARQVHLEPVEVDYFTQPEKRVEVRIDEQITERRLGELIVACGEVTVTRTTVGYRRLRQVTFELLERFDLDCPPQTLETSACWITLSEEFRRSAAERACDLHGGLHAVEHALTAALPLTAMCDPRDLEGATTQFHPQLEQPVCFLFDNYPGGIGLAERGFEQIETILAATRELVAACPCETGCPACITRQFCGSFNHPLDKLTAELILRAGSGGPQEFGDGR